MATKLDTSGGGSLREQMEKETKIKFLAVWGVIALVGLLLLGKGVIAMIGGLSEAGDFGAKADALDGQYAALKAEADAWHEEHGDGLPDGDDPGEGPEIVYKAMSCAVAAGNEIAGLQTKYLADDTLSRDEIARLGDLLAPGAKTSRWHTIEYRYRNNDGIPRPVLHWEFRTFYDAPSATYDCVWLLWDTTGASDYIVAMRAGIWHENGHYFELGDIYRTAFAAMLDSNGAIERRHEGEYDPGGVGGMLDDLTGGNTGRPGAGNGDPEQGDPTDNPDGDPEPQPSGGIPAPDGGGTDDGDGDGGDVPGVTGPGHPAGSEYD